MRTAFGVGECDPQAVVWAGRHAWRCGDVLIRPIADNAMASWSSGVLDGLHVEGVRLARPVRASDGRWIVAGWAACRYVPAASNPATTPWSTRRTGCTRRPRRFPAPGCSTTGTTWLTRSAAGAFGETRLTLDPARGGALYAQLAAYRTPVRAAAQVVHPELFGAVLFDRTGVLAVIDLVPCWRPKEWAAAVIVVDALAWGMPTRR